MPDQTYGERVRQQQRIEVRRSGERSLTEQPGISTRHSFSFGRHYDPDDVGFGALIALNEERLLLDHGYDEHPHHDTEIVTWVLSGALRHADSAGHTGVVVPGSAQRLSAGRGVVHAERNDGYLIDPQAPRDPVHFVQMWLRPDEPGGTPGYAQGEVSDTALAADWVPVVSGGHRDRLVAVGVAGATLWLTTAGPGERRRLPKGRLGHLLVTRGAVDLEGAGRLGAGDAARLSDPGGMDVAVHADTELLLWTFG